MAYHTTSKNAVISIETKDGDRLELGSDVIHASLKMFNDLEVSGYFGAVGHKPRTEQSRFSLTATFYADEGVSEIFRQSDIPDDEWRCPYCGHINLDEYFTCGEHDPAMGCARPKSAIHLIS